MVASPLIPVVVFLVGIGLVVWSVEEFVEHVAEAATGIGVSTFLLTVLLAGIDLENAVLGVAAAAGDLPDVALGTVFGEAVFILGAAVGLAGVLVPFEQSTPRGYLALTAVSPALLGLLSLDGRLSRFDGLLLVVGFAPLLWTVYRWEADRSTRFLEAEDADEFEDGDESDRDEDETDDRDLVELGIVLLTVAGMTAGSELAVTGARDVLAIFDLRGLAFGATVMSFIASLEEILLTVEPVREGRPAVGIGNIVGSMLFFVTANAGVIALVHPLTLSGAVFAVHWPFFLGSLALVLAFLFRGSVGRLEGAVLLAVYAAYWVAIYAF
ncbi:MULTISPECIES: sodium:calcium antiporter [Halorussus]|uniref:sodium:calcium antiporter n=1 Tax=Halorussus TaxID=1070314 RepID=UPI000E217A50|nr:MULTISPECIES: sodium:calcium antiporter [Halorussus]NHN58402.1 sodium:calcium antiporter [Halorussus sp. JP-T4]